MPYYRKNVLILSFTIFLAAMSWTQVVPFLPLFMQDLGVSKESLPLWTSLSLSIPAIGSIIFQPLWAKLGDRKGRKLMILRAGVALVVIYFALSFCKDAWQVLICRFLNGALTGFIPGSVALIATNTPEEYAPKSVALAQAGGAAGTIVGPAIGKLMADQWGYIATLRISGFVLLFCTICVLIFVTEPNKSLSTTKTSVFEDFAAAFKSPVLASIMFIATIGAFFAGASSPFLVLHLKEIGNNAPKILQGIVFSLPGVAFVVSVRFWTFVGEKHGFKRAIIIGLIGVTIFTIALAFVHDIWSFAVLYFIAGLFLAAFAPTTASMICLHLKENFRGRAYAINNSSGMFGALLSPLIGGFIWAKIGIPFVFIFVGIIFALSIPIFQIVRSRPHNPEIDVLK